MTGVASTETRANLSPRTAWDVRVAVRRPYREMEKQARIKDLWRQLHTSPERLVRKRGKLSVWELNHAVKRQELIIMRGFRVLSKAKRVDNRVWKRLWSDKIHLLKAFDGMCVQDTLDQWFSIDDILPVNAQMHEIPPAALRHGVAQIADDEIQDDYRTIGSSMDRLSPSASRDRTRPRAQPSAPMMPPQVPRRQQMGSTPEDAADVMKDIDHLVARISAGQTASQSANTSPKLDAPIRTTDEANATVERRRNLYTEKSVVKQRTPWNTQRLERIQADIQAVNARLGDWRKLHPEWRSGG